MEIQAKRPMVKVFLKMITINLLAAILLAHLKMTRNEIYNCLLVNGIESMRKRMDASHFKQLLLYVPDKDEADKLRAFRGDTATLNEADHLFLKVTVII